jgi:hypothetical protein
MWADEDSPHSTVQPPSAMNLTATGAVTLTNANIPATVSLFCSYHVPTGGSIPVSVTQASLSIIQVGTLQTGP